MRETGSQPSALQPDLEQLLYLDGQDILLSLADAQEDSLRLSRLDFCFLGRVTLKELMGYHRQLFNWRVLKENSDVFLLSGLHVQAELGVIQLRN